LAYLYSSHRFPRHLRRCLAGLIHTTLIFCLPGSKGACKDGWEGILSGQLDNRQRPSNFVELMERFSES